LVKKEEQFDTCHTEVEAVAEAEEDNFGRIDLDIHS
jgi:hypothetical protein